MPANARDIWLILRARDEANRVLRTFSRNVRDAGQAVALAQKTAQMASGRAALSQLRLAGASEAQIRAQKQHNANLATEAAAMRVAATAATEHGLSLRRLTERMSQVSSVAATLGLSLTIAGGVGVAAFGKMVKAAADYEKQVRFTFTQTDKGQTSLKELGNIGLETANKIAVPFAQIQPALFDIFSSMDVSVSQAQTLLEAFSRAAVAGQTDITSASRATIGILNAFKIPVKDINIVLDKQFQLVKEGIGTYEEWVGRIGQVSPSAVRAGQSLDFMLAALVTTTRFAIPASRSATAVSRALDALSHPKAVESMLALGVHARDSTGKFRPFINVLGELHTALFKLPPADRTAALIDIFKGAGGTIEARKFLQSILLTDNGMDILRTQFKNIQGASGSFMEAYNTMADSVSGKSQLLANKWEILKITIGQLLIPNFTLLIDKVSKMLDWFNKLPESTKRTIVTVLLLVTGLTLLAGIILTIVAGIAGFIALISAAGSALFIVLGVVTGLVAVFALLVAAFVLAWKKSQAFRDIIKDTVGYLKDFWDIAVDTAKGIKASFDQHVLPAIQRVWGVVQTKLLPAFRDFQRMIASEVIPRAREAGRIIKDVFAKTFEIVGGIINTVLVPALNNFADWWNANKGKIMPVIHFLAEIAKWAAIVVAVLVGVLVAALAGTVTTAILTFIGSIVAVVTIIKGLIAAGKAVGNFFSTTFVGWMQAVGAFFVSIWNSIKAFFVGIWNSIVNYFIGRWNALLSFLQGGVAVLRGIWEGFWSAFGGVIKAAWNVVVQTVRLGWNIIAGLFMLGVRTAVAVVSSAWNGIKTITGNLWGSISSTLRNAWNSITAFARGVWNNFTAFFIGIWARLSGNVAAQTAGIRSRISSAFNAALGIARSVFSGIYNAVKSRIDAASSAVSGAVSRIRGIFSGAGSWLYNAGRNIIQGLINGVTSMLSSLGNAISNAAATVKKYLPFSPAKKGPLSGRGNPFYSGQSIVKLLASGMRSQMGALAFASNQMAGSVANTGGVSMGAGGAGGSVNQTVNVYTQELNPRRQSAELGFLLAGRSR